MLIKNLTLSKGKKDSSLNIIYQLENIYIHIYILYIIYTFYNSFNFTIAHHY